MKNNTDFLTISEMFDLDTKIAALTDEIRKINSAIPEYESITPFLKSGVFYLTIAETIETGIDNLGQYCYRPDGWIKKRDYSIGKNTISYVDYNRWINNVALITKAIKNIDVTIWDSISFENWNSDDITISWED